MRINKFAAAAMLGISALGLSACATGLRTQVSRFQAMPAPQGQSFVIVAQDPAQNGGLEFSRYAELVAQQMQAQGFARAGSIDQATMVVRLGYGVDKGHTEIVSDPFAGAAGIAMILVGRNSDRTGERTAHVGVAAFCSAIGFTAAAVLENPYLAVAALTLAFAGQKSTLGPFWALGASALSGTAAAGGIALINSVGNLGGYVGPKLVGVITDKTGSSVTAMFVLGGAMLLMGLFAFTLSLTGRFRRDLPVPLPTEER